MVQRNGIHFIAGLPRSGSTLLAALLRQNPRFGAGMVSPVSNLLNAMMTAASQRNEAAVFMNTAQRERLLRACFDAYYADVYPEKIVFDTNRQWTTRLPVLTRLFPRAKVICCVRNPAWVLDSIETLIRRNAFDLSGIFNFDANGTVYSRINGLGGSEGMLGYAWNAVREAVYGPHADRLLLVRFDSLTSRPLDTLAAIYHAIGEPPFDHDPEHVEPLPDAALFDNRLGTPGLHSVRPSVRAEPRQTVLPPDLFARFERDAFWDDPATLPPGVRIV